MNFAGLNYQVGDRVLALQCIYLRTFNGDAWNPSNILSTNWASAMTQPQDYSFVLAEGIVNHVVIRPVRGAEPENLALQRVDVSLAPNPGIFNLAGSDFYRGRQGYEVNYSMDRSHQLQRLAGVEMFAQDHNLTEAQRNILMRATMPIVVSNVAYSAMLKDVLTAAGQTITAENLGLLHSVRSDLLAVCAAANIRFVPLSEERAAVTFATPSALDFTDEEISNHVAIQRGEREDDEPSEEEEDF